MVATQPFPIVVVEGTARERGYQHGKQAAERVASSVETHRRAISHFSGLDWLEVTKRALEFVPFLEDFAPDMLEELRGIAEGAGLPFADILGLNLRYELTFTPKMAEGCTAFAVLPGAMVDGHTYLGQDWDNAFRLRESCIVLRASGPGMAPYLTFTEAGVPGMIGLNGAGIGIARNALITADGGQTGVSINAIHYRVLHAQTMSDALAAVLVPRRSSPLNYLIGAPGDAISLEATPEDVDFISDTDDIITHANHFTSLRLGVRDVGKVALPDSLMRDRRLHRYLEKRHGRIDVATVFEGLKDHFNQPDSICRHADERDPEESWISTVASVVMDLDTRTMYLSDGNPCESTYRAIQL